MIRPVDGSRRERAEPRTDPAPERGTLWCHTQKTPALSATPPRHPSPSRPIADPRGGDPPPERGTLWCQIRKTPDLCAHVTKSPPRGAGRRWAGVLRTLFGPGGDEAVAEVGDLGSAFCPPWWGGAHPTLASASMVGSCSNPVRPRMIETPCRRE